MVPTMSAQPHTNPQLRAQNLSIWRGGRLIFKGVDIDLSAGQSLVVTGPNGSGKSTLLRILAGLLRPETGAVLTSPEHETGVRYSGHKDGLKGALSVRENLTFWAAVYKVAKQEAESVLDRLDLHKVAEMPTDILSAGWKRRVGLGRLMLGDAPIWILDEPYTSLDSDNIARLDAVLTEQTVKGGLVVMATHQITEFAPTLRIDMTAYQPSTVQMREDNW